MTACRTFPHSSRAVNSSVFPLPAHLPKNRSSFCATSPPAHSDYETGKSILKLLQDTCRRDGMTVVIITHNAALAAMADRIIRVKSGHIYSVRMNEHITPVEQIEW